MLRACLPLMVILTLAAFTPTSSAAQGSTTSSLSGVVLDSAGAVVPGVTVVVKNNATTTTTETITNERGVFSVPALDPGVYTVTASLSGFKTAVISDVRLLAAVPADLKVVLQVGGLEETVTVRGDTELVQTRSATVASTMNVDQIQNLPLPTRNAVNFATFLPGVNTTGVARDSNFNGLPESAVAIVLDGVNNNENYNKSTEGLFAMVTPRQDAIEAVTVTTATPGSESGGHGAIQIRFVTRSGTDRFSGSLYEYYRAPSLNTNYYFNQLRGLGKNQVTLNQYGGRAGGPIIIPGLYNGRGKAFYFFNYEELRLPNEFTRRRNVLTPSAAQGRFRYTASDGTREVNLFEIAAAAGQTSTIDPTIASVLRTISSATASGGTIQASPDPNMNFFDFLSPGDQYEKQPTTRIDYNLSQKHRLTGTYTWQVVSRDPDQLNSTDVRFPGMPNYRKYVSYRDLSSGALRSVLSASVVNELRGGIKWGPSYFGKTAWNGPETFGNQGGRALVLGNVIGGGSANNLTNIHIANTPSARSAWSWNIDDTVNWSHGNHGVAYGGSYYEGYVWVENQTMVPEINFGMNSADPANALFTNANFAGASAAQLTNARALYALLTGRVSSIVADARLNEATGEYQLLGARTQRLHQKEVGFFLQDTWRTTPSLTLSGGLRWDLQLPIEPTNDIMSTATFADLCGVSGVASDGVCNLAKPGVLTGRAPQFVQYDKGKPGYKTDWNNVSPSAGFAWRPGVDHGWLRAILGDPEDATLRGGYSLAYNREGMALFTGVIGANPGSTIPVRRDAQLGNLVRPGEAWPVLLRDETRVGVPAFPTAPNYPIAATIADDVSIFHPDITVSSAHSITLGLQRAVAQDTVAEIRYVGTFGRNLWEQLDYNGNCGAPRSTCANVNIVSNGFLDEFKRAQANLQANIAAGNGATFAYTGAPGTAPLPIYLAYFSGISSSRANDAAVYSSALFRDTNFINQLARNNPLPYNHASDNSSYGLYGDATRRANALAAGLAANFFIVNPNVDRAFVYTSSGFTDYNALQLEVRRRMARGLQLMGSYQYARGYESLYLGEAYPRARDETSSYAAATGIGGTVPRHAFKLTWNYSVPVGRGRRFGAGFGKVADSLLGGWEFHGNGRFQNRMLDFGNVRLVGMSLKELRDMYRVRYEVDPATGVKTVWMLPQDVILNTRRAFNVSATSSTGYSALGVPEGKYLAPAGGAGCIQVVEGDCAPRHQYVISPWFTRFDMSLVKKFAFVGRSSFELRFDVMNVFDSVNFTPLAQTGTAATINQVTSGYTDNSNTFDPGGRLGQLVFRFSW